jgi:outer membrane protein assembly factor BamB
MRPTVDPRSIKLASGRIFVAGSLGVGASSIPYLGAFSAGTGAPLWENTAPPGSPLGSSFVDIAVNGSRVVGVLLNNPIAVQAYDVTTGMLEWQAPNPGSISFSIGLNDDAVYIAGVIFLNPAPGAAPEVFSELMVRAYAASTGELLWDDRSHPSTVSPFINRFLIDLALDKSRLFVVGYTIDEDHSQGFPRHAVSGQDFLIRAYDIRSDVAEP